VSGIFLGAYEGLEPRLTAPTGPDDGSRLELLAECNFSPGMRIEEL